MIDACDEQRRPPLSVRGIGSGFSNSRGSHGVDSATDRSDKDRRVGFFSMKVHQIRTEIRYVEKIWKFPLLPLDGGRQVFVFVAELVRTIR